MRAAIYARVSTIDQEPENQLAELWRYVTDRRWSAVEYVDHGVSGAKDSRPALDRLVADAKRRRFDVLLCWRLDRLGRNLRHLVILLDELRAVGVEFVPLGEGIDVTTPAGKCSCISSRHSRSLNVSGFGKGGRLALRAFARRAGGSVGRGYIQRRFSWSPG
jgi:DNA invertase Pin-like site-specific DNA recombinase